MRQLIFKPSGGVAVPSVRLILIGMVLLITLFGLGGVFALPIWLKSFATKKIEQSTGRRVSIGSLHINPFVLSARITDFKMFEPDGQTAAMAVGEIYVNASVASLFEQAIILDEIRITHPALRVARVTTERFSFSDIVDHMATSPKSAATATLRFSLNNIQLIGGRIDFDDRVTGKLHHITQLNVALPFISNLPHDTNIFVVPSLSANVNGSRFLLKSKTKPFSTSLESSLNVELNKLDIPTYLGIFPLTLDYRPISGKLDTQLEISFRQIKGASQVAINGDLAVSDLAIATRGQREPALLVKQIALNNATYNLATNKLHVGTLRIDTPSIFVERFSDGRLNLLPTAIHQGISDKRHLDRPIPTGAHAPPAIIVEIDDLIVQNGVSHFEDVSRTPPIKIQADQLQLSMQHLTTASGTQIPFEFSTRVSRTGQVTLKGTASYEPPAINMGVDIKDLGLEALQGYVASMLNIDIHRLDLTTHGNLHLIKEADGPHVTYDGSAHITNLLTLDRINDAPFLSWKTLNLSRIEFESPASHAPLKLALGRIALSDFYARIIMNANGRLNLQDIVMQPNTSGPISVTTPNALPVESPEAQVKPSPITRKPKSGPQPIVRIGQISVVGGHVNYTDNYIKPNYTANLTNLVGTVGRVASDKITPASFEWSGRLDGDGSLDINGKINPLSPQLFLDLSADAKEIELTRLTPYASKYAGYGIEKGKLSVTVKYHIENQHLQAENHLFIDQLTFGDHVDSPDATKLPVLLAVALLKDSRGDIDINLPVSGSLSDPQFSIGGVILHVIVNLLGKAATAPFALIGSMFGNSEELGYVEFAPGSATLHPADIAKLDKLATALSNRPALKLDISGRIDPKTDTLIYKASLQKLRELRKNNIDAEEVNSDITADEYSKYLKEAYDHAKFSKPRDFIGLAKNLPREDMEKLILANTAATDNDMHELAMRRATNVRNYLVDKDHIADDRVFLVSPHMNANGISGNGKPNRVDFSLK